MRASTTTVGKDTLEINGAIEAEGSVGEDIDPKCIVVLESS